MLHRTFSRKGGQARSARKTQANRAKAAAYWKAVRAARPRLRAVIENRPPSTRFAGSLLPIAGGMASPNWKFSDQSRAEKPDSAATLISSPHSISIPASIFLPWKKR